MLITWAASSLVDYDSDADALFARMTTQPSLPRRKVINDAIVELKAASVWTGLDFLQVYAAADSQAALLNWKSASFDASMVNAPAFVADRGFTGDGATSYVDTNFNPATAGGSFAQNNASAGVWSRTADQGASSFFGWFDGTDGFTIAPRSATDTFFYRANQAASTSVAGTDGSGLFAAGRSAAGATANWRNGALLGTGVVASTALNSATLKMGRTATASYSPRQGAASYGGRYFNTTEQLAIYTALNNYMVAVGAV